MHRLVLPVCAMTLATLSARLPGQSPTMPCPPQWQAAEAPAGLWAPTVSNATIWDPDGTGPLPSWHVVVGSGLSTATIANATVVRHDGTTWQAIGGHPGDNATAVGVWNGALVVAFTETAAPGGHFVARYDGTSWQRLGPAGTFAQKVNVIGAFQGELVVGGDFATVNGAPMPGIARWNGSSWLPLGSGISGGVWALAVYAGRLYAGGQFGLAGGAPIANLAAWDGSAWSAAGQPNGRVTALGVRTTTAPSSTHLFVGGAFGTIGGISANTVARYNSAANSWTAITGLAAGTCFALLVRPTGVTSYELVVSHSAGGTSSVRQWATGTWSTLGDLAATLYHLAYWNGRLVATTAAVISTGGRVQAFDGTAWRPLPGPGVDGSVLAIADLGSEVVIGGDFSTIQGQSVNGIARGNLGAWTPLGTGVGGGSVTALARLANGDVVAGGNFTTAGGQPIANLARWSGSSWQALGSGVNGAVHALLVLPNGQLLAGGAFTQAGGQPLHGLAAWNGSSWAALGGTSLGRTVRCLYLRQDGQLLVGGDGSPNLQRWTGTTWVTEAAPPAASASITSVLTTATGDLMLATATGSTFLRDSLGSWSTEAMAATRLLLAPTGSVFGYGSGNAVRYGAGLPELGARGECTAMLVRPSGDLFVGGLLSQVGAFRASGIGRARPTCAATATPFGTGCAGFGGTPAFAATSLPWRSGTYSATATGLGAAALAADVIGFVPANTPLAALTPLAGPTCDLLVSPVTSTLVANQAGNATVQIAIPASTALVGTLLYDQILQVELGGNGQPQRISASNALQLRLGWL